MTMLSTLGMFNYDDTLFDELSIPSGVDKELLIDSILFETAELEILYSDFDYLKKLIGLWSNRELATWEKLNELFNEEYNPLYNVDAYETLTENRDLYGTSTDTHNRDETNTNQVSGFNNESFKNSEKNITDENITIDGATTDKGTITTTNRRYGNIGVTMNQQMVEAELRVRPKMNIINYITNSYKNRFCLLVY